ncbi:hypothetical protein K438DRAFT_1844352, partial [Mycena galopus ATCC 62051]
MIMDQLFRSSLESLIEDIEPISYRTNINQKNSTRADQVLLSLVAMFLSMLEHPEGRLQQGWQRVSKAMEGLRSSTVFVLL